MPFCLSLLLALTLATVLRFRGPKKYSECHVTIKERKKKRKKKRIEKRFQNMQSNIPLFLFLLGAPSSTLKHSWTSIQEFPSIKQGSSCSVIHSSSDSRSDKQTGS